MKKSPIRNQSDKFLTKKTILATAVTALFFSLSGTASAGAISCPTVVSSVGQNITNDAALACAQRVIVDNTASGKSIGTFTNSSTITSTSLLSGYLIESTNDINTLNNSGTLTSGWYVFEQTGGVVGNISNTGTITSTVNNAINLEEMSLGSLNNSGTINGYAYAINAYDVNIGSITNSGSMVGGAIREAISLYGTITTLTNTGAIYTNSATRADIFVNADVRDILGVITTFNNAQGGNASTAATTALKYNGNLPTNYNIIVNSPTSYGQLNYYKGSAGAPSLSGLNFGISSTSTLAVGTYSSVLSSKNSTFSAAGTAFTGTPTLVSSSLGTYTLTTSDSGLTYDLNILTVNGGGGSSNNSATYTNYVTSTNNPAAAGAAYALGQVSSPTGAMATVTTYLASSATDQQKSNAISQTVPVIVGAAPAATVNTSRNLTQIVQARQSQAAGLSSGEGFIVNKDVWMKGFGVWGKQNDLNGVTGYQLSTGGLAIGGDRALSPRANIGGVVAFANSNVNGNNPAAPNSMAINSYQIGGYGDYAITEQLNYNYQVDFGINQNKGTRNILTAGVIASSNYYSYSGHLGSGLKYMMPVVEKLTFIPSTRVDYTQVQSNAYSETGAGTLNLITNSQKYEELLVSADLRFDYEFKKKLKGTINAGVAYNTMNNQVQMTSIYQGGGPSFTTNGMQVSPTLYAGGLGIIGNITKDVELIARYDAQYRTTGYFSQMASIRAKINF
jgi:outer membrane autotransporter protein